MNEQPLLLLGTAAAVSTYLLPPLTAWLLFFLAIRLTKPTRHPTIALWQWALFAGLTHCQIYMLLMVVKDPVLAVLPIHIESPSDPQYVVSSAVASLLVTTVSTRLFILGITQRVRLVTIALIGAAWFLSFQYLYPLLYSAIWSLHRFIR